jgi:hypothetical protein
MASPASLEVHDLCKKCQTIDLEEIFSRRYPAQVWEEHILDLGPVQALAKGCALCRFFATMANSKANTMDCELLLTSTKSFYFDYMVKGELGDFKELDDTILLFVKEKKKWSAPRRFQVKEDESIPFSSVQPTRTAPHIGLRIICPEKFDRNFVKDSISYCSTNHISACQPHIIDAPDFFRLIDCESRQVIVAQPGCEYLALSYVWGTKTRTSIGRLGDLDNCPKVIIDSMDVTLNLSFRYLWIDRYCIDQLDDEDKQHQIRQMDLIYANAVATIIAAAGDDPEYGLPGVNGTLRKHQPQIHVCGHLLASTLPHPSRSVSDSKWTTRGWTYQEGILSKRRIVFTDDQVIFECNSMHTAESQALPLDVLHTIDKRRFRKEVRHGAFRWKTPDLNIMHFVAEFSKKELTHPADALNAMQGIFQMFLKAKTPIYHIEGVPLVPHQLLAFDPEKSFIQGLSWYHKNPGERRPEFPSWSWTGWTGQLANSVMLNPPPDWFSSYGISIRLESEYALFPEKNGWQNILSRPANKRVHFLYIKGQTLKCTLVRMAAEVNMAALSELTWWDPTDYALKFEMEKNTVFYVRPRLDLDGSQIEGKPLECIWLGDEAATTLDRFPRTLLVETYKAELGWMKRVGCTYKYSVYCMQDGKRVYLGGEGCLAMLKNKLQLRRICLG